MMIRFLKRCMVSVKLRLPWIIFSILPVKKNKITISSYYGRGYGDNSKYIVNELLKFDKKFQIIWLVNSDKEKETLPEGVEPCKIDTFLSVYHLLTSRVWIDNCRKFYIMFKKKKQFYLQTWHGFALKRIEKDAEENLASNYAQMATRDSKHTDCIISCSKFMSEIYRNSFWYDGEIVETGAPRNDILLNDHPEIRNKVFEYYNLSTDKKVILYAPTFRADRKMDAYSIDYQKTIAACEQKFGGKFVFITRLHPNVAAMSTDLTWSDDIINGSYYPDMQELMVAADVIITDYSSVMFDFSLTYKPCFQFATDIESYKNDRNFYFELDKLPFSVSTDNEELEKHILEFNKKEYKETLDAFYGKVGMNRDGKAAKLCAEMIIEKCYGKER